MRADVYDLFEQIPDLISLEPDEQSDIEGGFGTISATAMKTTGQQPTPIRIIPPILSRHRGELPAAGI